MKKTHVCPQDILDLFKNEETQATGLQRAVDWAKATLPQMGPHDEILMPHPETGELISFERQAHGMH